MARCIVFSIVFTVIGALSEFSSGSTRSTGSTGIEVNPSKMEPWFPAPGSRMTVVSTKLFSFTQLAMVTILQSKTFIPKSFPMRGPSATALERTLLIILSPDFGQLHSGTEPNYVQAFPYKLSL